MGSQVTGFLTATKNEETELISDINCGSFIMKHSKSYTHNIAGAPVHDFDLLDLDNKRIGRVQMTISTHVDEIKDSGNIGGFMLKGHECSDSLVIAGLELEKILQNNSITNIHYVAGKDCREQIDAIQKLGATLTGEFEKDGSLCYSYEKNVSQ